MARGGQLRGPVLSERRGRAAAVAKVVAHTIPRSQERLGVKHLTRISLAIV